MRTLQENSADLWTKSKADSMCNEGFSGADRKVLYFVVNRFQVMKMKDIVQKIDPMAYITLSEVANIFSVNTEK